MHGRVVWIIPNPNNNQYDKRVNRRSGGIMFKKVVVSRDWVGRSVNLSLFVFMMACRLNLGRG